MSAPLDDIAASSAFVYALAERHTFVTSSTLDVVLNDVRRGWLQP
jgi:hypothetical protein